MLYSIEHISVLLNLKEMPDFNFTGKYGNIELQTKLSSVEIDQLISFDFKVFRVEFNSTAFNHSLGETNIASTAAIVKNISNRTTDITENKHVYSQILSIVVEDKTGTVHLNSGQFVKFYARFQSGKKLYFGDKVQCSFWHFDNLSWSDEGCNHLEDESSRYDSTCKCDHTTNLAVLIDVNNQETDENTKAVISYISSSFTILFASYAVYVLYQQTDKSSFDFRRKRLKDKSNRAKINLHIAFWLIVSHLLVVLTLDQDGILFGHFETPEHHQNALKMLYCGLSSLVLLYSLLTTFSVMLLINYHLYKTLSKTIMYFNLKKYLLVAYLYPAVIVLLSILGIYFIELSELENPLNEGLNFANIWTFIISFLDVTNGGKWRRTIQSLYGQFFCWVSSKQYQYHIFIFVGPMTLAIGGNVLLLTLSGYHWIKSCLFELEYCPKNARPNRYRHKIKLLNSMFLFFNSCTPWAMYLLYINNYLFGETGAKVFSITFIILLGTQGFALWVEQYYLYLSCKSNRGNAVRQQTSSTLTMQVTPTTSETIGL